MAGKFSVELWDQFEEIYRRVATGKEFTVAVADFVHKRAQIEREYSKKLQALCKSAVEKDSGTLLAGWSSLKDETENISKKHGELAEALFFQVEEPLNNFLKETKKNRTTLREQGRKIVKDVQAAEAKTLSAKVAFEQARKKQDETKEEYERAAFTNQQSPQVEKLSKKMKADAKKSSTLDKKYSEAVDGCRQLQDKFFDDEMPRILEDFQTMEETRIDRTKVALQAFIELQRGISPEILSSCDRMAVNVKNISTSADLQSFISEKRTNAPKPDRAIYEAYNPELGKCVKAGGGSSSAPTDLKSSQNMAAPVASSRNIQPAAVAASSPSPAKSSPAATVVPRKGISKCRGLFDYNTEDPNELCFKQGDIITVLQKDPSGWWQGELNGKIGVFPSVDWVEELSENGTPVAAAAPAKNQCRALYDYTAENEYELSIYQGDIITIDRDEEGWFCGTNQRGQYGRYPSNYVQIL